MPEATQQEPADTTEKAKPDPTGADADAAKQEAAEEQKNNFDAAKQAEAKQAAALAAKQEAEAKKMAEEASERARREAERWRRAKLNALGAQVYYRSGNPAQDGHEGTSLHSGVITQLYEDWSADLTVFPRRAGVYHVERAPLARVEDVEQIAMGCYRPRD